MHQNPHCFVRIFEKSRLAPTHSHRTLPISPPIHNPKHAQRLTLVPNQRRLDLLLADAMRSLPEGSVVVHPPIEVLSQWTARLLQQLMWLEGKPMPRVLDTQAQAMAWQKAWPDAGNSLSDTEKYLAARQAMAADRLLRQWYPQADAAWLDRNFFQARQAVENVRKECGWCTADELVLLLCEQLEAPRELPVRLPPEIVFHGFHEWTRLETRLLDALEQRGVILQLETASHSDRGKKQARVNRAARACAFETPEQELRAAAHWALNQLGPERSGTNQCPIAVVVEGLDRDPAPARRIFEQAFAARRESAGTASFEPDFYLPYGAPLSHHAAIQDALVLLRLAMQGTRIPVPIATLSRCLLSPHWAAADLERTARARLELRLRKDGAWRVSLASLFEQARRSRDGEAPELSLAALRAATEMDWSNLAALEQALRLLQWPGPAATGRPWQSLLDRFSPLLERAQSLDGAGVAERLLALQHMCLAQQQQGVGGPLSAVHLLAPEDAVGQEFSAAWVVGLSASRWPGQPLSNPFLPADAAQRIPRTSPAGELMWCEGITEGLTQLAPEIIFSWPSLVDDVPQSPSPLLGSVPIVSAGLPAARQNDTATLGSSAAWSSYANHPWLEAVPDGPGLPLKEQEPIKGGAATLSDQSASPLAAYMKHRLNAHIEPMPEAFADAAWRGQLLHRALQALYQPALESRRMPDATAMSAAVPAAIEAGMQAMRAFNRLSPVQYRAEQQRLQRLLQAWLEFDLQRPAFRVVALEQKLETELLGHPIRLRVDRVDAVGHAVGTPGLLIIDYKSSAQSLSAWARDRLGEPQLPLYATVWQGETPVAGLALAAVAFGKTAINGVIAGPELQFHKVKAFRQKGATGVHKRFSGWPEALEHWRSSIAAIASEFIAGDARNTVYELNNYTVQELAPLLRLEEGAEWQRQRGSST